MCVCSSVRNFVLEGFLVLYRQERRGFSSEVEGGTAEQEEEEERR